MKLSAALLCALLALAGPAAAADLPEDDGPPPVALPPAAQVADLDERLGKAVRSGIALTDMDGRQVRLSDYLGDGKPLVLVLAYYRCPMLCGLVLHGLVGGLGKLSLRLGEDYRALTVSFDPRDTPEAAALKRKSTLSALTWTGNGEPPADAWPFLVGREHEVRALADDIGFRFAYDSVTDQYAHPAAVIILTPDGRVSRYLYGAEPSARDLRLALLEASEGRVGGIVDRVLMTCYRYDPASRRYGPYIAGFFRLGGVAIVGTVGGVLAVLWRRERRLRAARAAEPRRGPAPAASDPPTKEGER
jgi:protein SCO1/2